MSRPCFFWYTGQQTIHIHDFDKLPPMPHLSQLTLHHFRNIPHLSIELSPQTLLAGAAAAELCLAFDLLRAAASGHLAEWIEEQGGYAWLAGEGDIQIEARIEGLRVLDDTTVRYLRFRLEGRRGSYRVREEVIERDLLGTAGGLRHTLLRVDKGHLFITPPGRVLGEVDYGERFFSDKELVLAQMTDGPLAEALAELRTALLAMPAMGAVNGPTEPANLLLCEYAGGGVRVGSGVAIELRGGQWRLKEDKRPRRLAIFCEGHTEERVLPDFLAPFTGGFDEVTVRNFEGASNLLKKYSRFAEEELADEQTVVLCLLDMHNVPLEFPPSVDAHPDPLRARVDYLEATLRRGISHEYQPRFLPFGVVMAVETWLIADAAGLNIFFSGGPAGPVRPINAPERVRDPVALLKNWMRRWRGERYNKTEHGEVLFGYVEARRVLARCPHFRALAEALLRVQPGGAGEVGSRSEAGDVAPDAGERQRALWADIQARLAQAWARIEANGGHLSPADVRAIEIMEAELAAVW